MSATKSWVIGDVLTASDLNGNFSKLPYATSAFQYTVAAALAINTQSTFAVALPVGRFAVAPIVVVTTNDPYLTGYVSSITSATAIIGVRNNGNTTSASNFVVGFTAVQMTAGTATG